MELNIKIYSTYKTKEYFKKNNFFFLFHGINRSSRDWISITEQELKNLNFSYYKNLNRLFKKTLNNSTYKILLPIIKGPTFFIKYTNKSNLTKQLVLDNFESLLFILLVIKFNNKVYPISLFKSMTSLKDKENNVFLYLFYLTNFKYYKKLLK